MDQQIVVYKPSEKIRMEVKTDGETVWLTQEQMCQLFGRERSVITKHIRNIFGEGELPQEGYVQNLHITSDVGGRRRPLRTEPPRCRIGFGADENDLPAKPYAKL